MNLFDNLTFLIFFASSPIWLLLIGLYFQKRSRGGYAWQTVANSFYFLIFPTLIADAALVIGKVSVWNNLFHNPYFLLLWLPVLFTPLVAFKVTSDTGRSTKFGYYFLIWFFLQIVVAAGFGLILAFVEFILKPFVEFILKPFGVILQSFK